MNDVVLAALFSSAGAAVVGAASAVATIFGPAWRERAQRREESDSAATDLRYGRALDFVEALAGTGLHQYWHDTVELNRARARFVSTLRHGEGAVEKYTAAAIGWTKAGGAATEQAKRANQVGDVIFGWLRGDITTDEIEDLRRELREGSELPSNP